MPTFDSSVSIEAPAEAVFAFVSDIRNLPRFFDPMIAIEPGEGDHVRLTIPQEGRAEQAEGWFRLADHKRRVEWGHDGPDDYHGWMEVDAEGLACSVTIKVHTTARVDKQAVTEALDRTMWALKTLVEQDAAAG
jgi:hypothetical protein